MERGERGRGFFLSGRWRRWFDHQVTFSEEYKTAIEICFYGFNDPAGEKVDLLAQREVALEIDARLVYGRDINDIDENKFVGDRTRAIRVQAPVKGRDVIADYLSWGIYDKRAMNDNDIVTGQLTSISLASAGTINLKENSNSKFYIVWLLPKTNRN